VKFVTISWLGFETEIFFIEKNFTSQTNLRVKKGL